MSQIRDNSKKISAFKRMTDKVKYGLVLQSLRNQLVKVGIEITPYYWLQEGINPVQVPEISGSFSEYKVV